MRYFLMYVIVLSMASLAVNNTQAQPVTFTYEGIGTGHLGTTSFTDASFTITALSDTENLKCYASGVYIEHNQTSIDIAGVGTYDFLEDKVIGSFANNNLELVGIYCDNCSAGDLLYAPTYTEFGSWNLLSSIGPISGTGQTVGMHEGDLQTTGGRLIISESFTPVTFQASVLFGPDILVAPDAYNFGNVEWNKSITTIINISNTGSENLEVISIALESGNTGFAVTLSPSLPTTLPPDGIIDVEITFTPLSFDPLNDVLIISSNDPDEPEIQVPLSGVGVLDDTPSEQVKAVLNFAEEAIAAGDLSGDGAGASSDNRLSAFINMIEAAGNLLEAGSYDEGCQQLSDVYNKTDGTSPPADFVTGPATEELAAVILELMSYYACE